MELDPEARKVLSLARAARTPSAADKRRVQRRLALSAGLSVAAASGAAAAHAAEGAGATAVGGGLVSSIKLYVAGGALLLSAAGGGYALLSQPSAAPAASPRPAAVQVPVAAPAPAPPAAPPVEPAAPPSPAPRAAAPRTPRGATLAKELDLLHSAQSAWRARDSVKTLELLEQHARQYPRSELRLERAALRVLALCEQGRTAEAQRLARVLIRRAPNSPVRATIEESCAIP